MNTNNGWKMVPVEPTEEMEVAAENDYEQTGATFPRWKSAYAAMLAAAPAAPTAPAANGWLDIASAPKDGVTIWAIGQIYGKPFQYECNWNGNEWYHGFGDGWASLEPSHWMPLPAAPGSPASTVADEGAKDQMQWRDGAPPFPQNQEWFIAETTYGDRVVLCALPEGMRHDYKTADGTYLKSTRVKRWMQFPDCEYLPPAAAGDALSDPALQKLFGEVITGALAFGAQGVNPPHAGHWLEPFWEMARSDATLANAPTILDHPLLREVLGYIEDAGPADVWGAAQAWMALRDAALSASQQGGE